MKINGVDHDEKRGVSKAGKVGGRGELVTCQRRKPASITDGSGAPLERNDGR